MSAHIDTQWFVDRLAERKMSQRALSKLLGLDSSAVSLMFRGKRQMKLTEAAEIARIIGAPLDDVLRHAGVHEADRTSASIAGFVDKNGEVHTATEEIDVPCPAGLPDGVIAVQSRAGDYTDGWLYFVEYPKRGVPPEAIGRFCVVRVKNGIKTLGVVTRSYTPGRYKLDGFMQSDAVELEAAEPVLAIIPP